MITHKIESVKPAPPPFAVAWPHTSHYNPQQQQRDWYNKKRHAYGKTEYAMYLRRYAFEKGQILCRNNATFPYNEDDYVLIVDIQEIHYLAETDEKTMHPLSLYVKDTKGNRFWTINEKWYVSRVILQDVKDKLGVA